jgi:phage baseplate assembly protein W
VPSVPQLRFPFQVAGGQVATVEQDSIEDIKQCVLACLSTPKGSRAEDPDYGVRAGLFSKQARGLDTTAVLSAVEEAEPRARLLSQVELEGLVRRVTIGVQAVEA